MSEQLAASADRPRLDRAGLAAMLRPRIAVLVLVTTWAGYVLERPASLAALPWVLLATLLVSAGGCALNHWMERDADALMERTAKRPLVTGALTERQVFRGGLLAVVAGLATSALGAGPMATLLLAAASASYLLVYTPLKRRTSTNTWIGAVPGALPLLVGSAAAGGPSRLALIGFLLIFLWQLPHFFAIASMYRDDYRQGGLRMLSGDDPDDELLRWQMPMQVMSVMLVSALPVLIGPARMLYALTALLVGLVFLAAAVGFRFRPDRPRARKVVLASVVYLPLVLGALVIDVACTGPELHGGSHGDHAQCSSCSMDATSVGDDGNPYCDHCVLFANRRERDDVLDDVHASDHAVTAPPLEFPDDGTELPSYGALPPFELVGNDGEPFGNADLLGDVWIVDFIYARCGSICADMSKIYIELQDERLPARFLSITIDPQNDTPAMLDAYRKEWGGTDDWTLLTGERQRIQDLADDGFRLPVNTDVVEVEGMPRMFHSGRFALVDRQGRVRGYYDPLDALERQALVRDTARLADAGR